MEQEFGFQLPRELRIEFSKIINKIADATGREIFSDEMYRAFEQEYLERHAPLRLESFHAETDVAQSVEKPVTCFARLAMNGTMKEIRASGNGPIDAFVHGLNAEVLSFRLLNYAEHSLGQGAEARAASYIQIARQDGSTFYGVGVDTNIELASIRAVLSAVNRALTN